MQFKIKELREQQDLLGDDRMTDDEILASVLGHRSGYVWGQGYGALPLRKREHFQSSQASIVQMLLELQQDFDKKLKEEQEKYEAKLAAVEQKMEEKIAALMQRMQRNIN